MYDFNLCSLHIEKLHRIKVKTTEVFVLKFKYKFYIGFRSTFNCGLLY